MSDPNQPYVLPQPRASRWIMTGLCLPVIGIAVYLLFIGPTVWRLDVSAIFVFSVPLMGALYLWHLWSARISLWLDLLEIYDGFRRRRFRREDIAGYRSETNHGVKRIWLEPVNGRAISVPAEILTDRRFKSWFGSLPNIDARERSASKRALENDPLLGATPAERQSALKSLRHLALIANVLGAALAIALLWHGVPGFVVAVALLSPPLSVALQLWSRGNLSLGILRNDTRPTLYWMNLALGFGLFIRLLDLRLIDVRALGNDALVAASIFTLVAVAADRRRPRTPLKLALVFGFCVVYAGCLLAQADVRLDHALPTVVSLPVVDKYEQDGRSTAYYVVIDPEGAIGDRQSESVSRDLYAALRVGGRVCVVSGPGALGIGWYRLERC